MIDKDNIDKAKELLWAYCEKCQYHASGECKREGGTCEVDEAWEYLDSSISDDKPKRTVPINGWRGRTLAEYYFGSRKDEAKFVKGLQFVISAEIVQILPAFDTGNQAYVDSFHGDVVCKVEEIVNGYGFRMSIRQVED